METGQRGATLGRSRECDIVVEDANVSRRHAELRPRGSAWVLSDLGSTNGTRLNGWRVGQPVPVQAGDLVAFGSAQFVVCPDERNTAERNTAERDTAGPRDAGPAAPGGAGS